jgi:hypothetical protein
MTPSSQGFLEPIVVSALEDTVITRLSVMARLLFSDEESGSFFKTDDGAEIRSSDLMPTRDGLVEWVRRLKVHHPLLKTFEFVKQYNTIDNRPALPNDNTILKFEYREPDDADSQSPLGRNDIGHLNHQAEADAQQYRYTVYSQAVNACYNLLVQEGEAFDQREAAEYAEYAEI